MPLSIGVLQETSAHEARVALTPDVAAKLLDLGAAVNMQRGAGERSHFADESYKGAQFHPGPAGVLAGSTVLLKVQTPAIAEVEALAPGAVVVGFMQPHVQLDMVRRLRERKITSFAVELIPRISRAQSMDALSSQAAAAGYKAALLAANALDKFLPMLTTAAGTIRPAQVLVIGAGVAGLQAIATARRLGAIVEAYDVRAATKEQIQSLGAKFVDTGVAALLIAGAHRNANKDGSADVAHAPISIFHTIHETLSQELRPASGNVVILQIHGFHTTKHEGYPQAVLGFGQNTALAETTLAGELEAALSAQGIKVGLCMEDAWRDLCGRTNGQGAIPNGGIFIHIELDELIRKNDEAFVTALVQVFGQ